MAFAQQAFYQKQNEIEDKGNAEITAHYSKLREKLLPRMTSGLSSDITALELNFTENQKNTQYRDTLELMIQAQNGLTIPQIIVIAFDNILSGLMVRDSKPVSESKVIERIGKDIEFQCFIAYLDSIDPRITQNLARTFIRDSVTQKYKKISITLSTVDDFNQIEWEWMTTAQHIALGNFVKESIFTSTKYFESCLYLTGAKSQTKSRRSIILTEIGERSIALIREQISKTISSSEPMLCPPRPWTHDFSQPGGYWTLQPGERASLVHDSFGTIPSNSSVLALNRLQAVPWSINTYTLNLLSQLTQRGCTDIGSFRSFDEDLYDVQVPLHQNPKYANLPWNNDDSLSDDEKRQRNYAYALKMRWQKNKGEKKSKAINPQRVLATAERFRTVDRFWCPWFMDTRTRMYCLVDTLNIQGGDYQRALIQFADGIPYSIESQFDLLVSIGTTYGNGIDKLDFNSRASWAYETINHFVNVAADPLHPLHLADWTSADEPFQFLALLNEYNNIFIKRIQDTHHVVNGRDATCSGIQITGAMLRDEVTCRLVNVLPADKPQDAYADVAEKAKVLLSDLDWLLPKIDKREANREEAYAKKMKTFRQLLAGGLAKESDEPLPYIYRGYHESKENIEFLVNKVLDRSCAKMVVMLTPYGGTYPTMLRHVSEKVMEKAYKVKGLDSDEDKREYANAIRADLSTVTHALIEGMAISLKAFSQVNAWFQALAKAALLARDEWSNEGDTFVGTDPMISWETPVGSVIRQWYGDSIVERTTTFVGNTASHRSFSTYKDLEHTDLYKLNKRNMQTALAANVVHSLDASIIQDAISKLDSSTFNNESIDQYGEQIGETYPLWIESNPFTAVHDCFYAPAGGLSLLHQRIRDAFVFVCSSNVLAEVAEHNLPDEKHRELLPHLFTGNADLSLVQSSQYLFS